MSFANCANDPTEAYCFQRARLGIFRVKKPAAKAGSPNSLSLLFTRCCMSAAEMSGKVNFPASKQWEQYMVLFEPSALVPPPFSSRRIGMPQDWQFL